MNSNTFLKLTNVFKKKEKLAKTITVTIQSTHPLSNSVKLVQLDVPVGLQLTDFVSAILGKLELAGHRFHGYSPEFSMICSEGPLAILDNRDVSAALTSNSRIGVNWTQINDVKWVCKQHRTTFHHFFVSYRQSSERTLVQMLVPLFETIGKRRFGSNVNLFWDEWCLNDAEDFKLGFINGIQNSRVILYLLSAETLKSMNANILAGKEDNVVTEIEKGLELAAQSCDVILCPVLVDTVDNSGNIITLNQLPKFDATSQSFLNEQFVSLFSPFAFADRVHIHNESGKRLCDTMSDLFKNNCIHINPDPEKIHELLYRVIDLVNTPPERTADLSHTVPKPPVHFIGREDILNKVHNHLVMHGAVILAAQGGMGKSSIALEYANQYKNTYDSIFWVPCNTVASAISAFQIYARSLFMTDNADTMPAENIVQLICGKFASLHRYLLILDNVDDESVLDQILESSFKFSGDVLITSRSNAGLAIKMRQWVDPLLKTVQVKTWSNEVTHEFLRLRLGETFNTLLTSESQSLALHKLLHHIAGLPLAAEQAASFIEREQTTFSDLVRHINGYLTQSPDNQLGIASQSLSAIVIAGLQTINSASLVLMQVLSFYACQEIPIALVDQAVNLLHNGYIDNQETANIQYNRVLLLRQLSSQSLIHYSDNNMISLHPLIQEIVRSDLRKSLHLQEEVSKLAAQALLEVFPKENKNYFETSQVPTAIVLVSHIVTICDLIPANHISNECFKLLDDLQWQCQSFCQYISYYTLCQSMLQDRYNRLTRHFGKKENIEIAKTLRNMGKIARFQSAFKQAEQYYEESLAITINLFGTRENLEVALTLNLMGDLKRSNGHIEKAKMCYEESLATKVKIYGTRENIEVAVTLNNLGLIARAHGDLNTAMQFFEESLKIKVKVHGMRDHPDAAVTLNNMGLVAHSRGQHEKAMQIYEESC